MRSHVLFTVLVAIAACIVPAASATNPAMPAADDKKSLPLIITEDSDEIEERYIKPGTDPGHHNHPSLPEIDIAALKDKISVLERYITTRDWGMGESPKKRKKHSAEDDDDDTDKLYIYTKHGDKPKIYHL